MQECQTYSTIFLKSRTYCPLSIAKTIPQEYRGFYVNKWKLLTNISVCPQEQDIHQLIYFYRLLFPFKNYTRVCYECCINRS